MLKLFSSEFHICNKMSKDNNHLSFPLGQWINQEGFFYKVLIIFNNIFFLHINVKNGVVFFNFTTLEQCRNCLAQSVSFMKVFFRHINVNEFCKINIIIVISKQIKSFHR